VFAAMDDIAGETTEAEGEFSAEIQKSADEGEQSAEKEECAAEFAEGVHRLSLEELREIKEVKEVEKIKNVKEGEEPAAAIVEGD
jgi:hypothetical protein